MLVFLLRRLAQSVFVLIAMMIVVFFGVYMIGNPVDILISPDATPAEIDETMARFGFDQPVYIQFLKFIGNALQGDLGRSFVHGEPAVQLILSYMPATLELAVMGLLFSVLIGVPLGVYAGYKADRWQGRAIMTGSIFGFSLPNFWVGMLLILIFAVELQWLPSTGRGETVEVLGLRLSIFTADGLQHMLLPALTLALYKASLVTRLARAGTQEALVQDYVKFARAKGLSETRILVVHVLKNIMIPIITVLGLELGSMIAFAVVTETVFAWPGMGKLLIDSILTLDRPVIVSYLMLTVIIFIVINFTVDVIYTLLDPRVRVKGGTA
ncbi:ABC transporter permease [Roseibacterium sp. SDUM158016]|jgi:peptide/nickel transport system permease protein|uniref:ABC transporter permease n=1 Tax=Roseicyclus sediminis TaxID=2980997 RepID=UPI0021D03444|nr:ABC transporter permease [Roseibacterium sp. SDUM158016]MCU4653010.1 ABC transporter permease [Roseibacterium sp. SDUM158016]